MRAFLFMLLFSGFICHTFAQKDDSNVLFGKGLAAYQKEEYESAVQFFERALTSDYKSAECFTNLGLAYHKSGDHGRAVLSFERALRVNPDYRAAKQNLQAARQLMDTEIKSTRSFWLFGIWNSICYSLSSKYWAIVFWIFLYAGSGLFILKFLTLNEWIKKNGTRTSVALLLSALLFLAAGSTAYTSEYNKKAGIILNKNTGIRTAPGLDGEDIMVLSAGVKVFVLEQSGDWTKLRLENGVQGWLPTKFFELI